MNTCAFSASSLHVRLLSTSKDIACISCMYRLCKFALHSSEANTRKAQRRSNCTLLPLGEPHSNMQTTHAQGASVAQHLRWVHNRAKSSWESHHCAWHRGMWRGNSCFCFHCKINEKREDDCAGVRSPWWACDSARSWQTPVWGTGRPLTPRPHNLQCPHRKIHQAFADGLLVFDPLSAFHGPAARERFKGTQARTKNTPGWSVSAVSEERWLTFPKFNSHSLSLRLHKEYTLYLQHRTPRVWCHTLEKPH